MRESARRTAVKGRKRSFLGSAATPIGRTTGARGAARPPPTHAQTGHDMADRCQLDDGRPAASSNQQWKGCGKVEKREVRVVWKMRGEGLD